MTESDDINDLLGNKSYRQRQRESFEFLGTHANEWRACKITAWNQATAEPADFDMRGTGNYKVVTPVLDRLNDEKLAKLNERLSQHKWAKDICQLCGHLIKYPRPIVHDSKKLIMYIGCDCLRNYAKLYDQYKKEISDIKDYLLRNKFRAWVSIGISDIDIIGVEYPGSKRLKAEYFKLKITLEMIQKAERIQNDPEYRRDFNDDEDYSEYLVNHLSILKIKEIFRQAHTLRIKSVPVTIRKKKVKQKITNAK